MVPRSFGDQVEVLMVLVSLPVAWSHPTLAGIKLFTRCSQQSYPCSGTYCREDQAFLVLVYIGTYQVLDGLKKRLYDANTRKVASGFKNYPMWSGDCGRSLAKQLDSLLFFFTYGSEAILPTDIM